VTVERIEIDYEGKRRLLNLHVRPARRPGLHDRLILVVFELLPDAAEGQREPPVAAEPLSKHLAEENQHLKEQLSSTIEQYEGSLEELKASNEELQAINEEMRSASEELETSKEELQSINEELTTVNQELKSNIDQLARANSDLQNLMASTEIGTIFLDRRLVIKRFTPGVQGFFNLIDADVGRPLSNITHKLSYPELLVDADKVLNNLSRVEREVRSQDRWFLVKLLPYRTLDDHIDGVVINFIDITERKGAQEALAQAQANLEFALQAAEMGIWTVDLATQKTSTSLRHRQIFGQIDPAFVWRSDSMRERVIPEDQPKLDEAYSKALKGGTLDLQVRVKWDDGTVHWVYDRGHVVYDQAGKPQRLAGVSLDVTDRKHAEEQRLRFERDLALRNERDRMGQELHDTLAQAFTAIKLQLDAAEQDLSITPHNTLQHVVRARDIAMSSLQEARLAIQALRSEHLSNAGLDAALEQMAAQATTQLDRTVKCQRKGHRYSIDPTTENELYRIAQEALTNALRHASASNITIELTYSPKEIRLRVSDDGRGFLIGSLPDGFGLRGMRERAHRIGASIQITSAPGKGSHVLVVMPRRQVK
jgi:two-component system CheB/CheR fusion protein